MLSVLCNVNLTFVLRNRNLIASLLKVSRLFYSPLKMFLVPSAKLFNRTGLRYVVSRSFASAPPKIEKTINNVTILGRVGADPQLRGNAEHPVVTFSVATHNNYKYENGDWAQRTDWHRIVVFKPNLRETVMGYLKKGQRTMIQGKITYGEITDQQGNTKPSSSIIAEDVIFFRDNQN